MPKKHKPIVQILYNRYGSEAPKLLMKGSSSTLQKLRFYLYRRGALDALGGKCVICNISDWRMLEIDHVDDDGNYERKILGISHKVLYQLICFNKVNLEKYRILCSNHHSLKRYIEKEDFIKLLKEPPQTKIPEFSMGINENKDIKEFRTNHEIGELNITIPKFNKLKNVLGMSQEQLTELLGKIQS